MYDFCIKLINNSAFFILGYLYFYCSHLSYMKLRRKRYLLSQLNVEIIKFQNRYCTDLITMLENCKAIIISTKKFISDNNLSEKFDNDIDIAETFSSMKEISLQYKKDIDNLKQLSKTIESL